MVYGIPSDDNNNNNNTGSELLLKTNLSRPRRMKILVLLSAMEPVTTSVFSGPRACGLKRLQ